MKISVTKIFVFSYNGKLSVLERANGFAVSGSK